jgi:hypothetical protein
MKKYAVLNSDGVVNNIIIAASLEIAEQVSSSYCVLIPLGSFVDIGYSYSEGVFSAPEEETPAEETPSEETPA